MSSLSVEGSAVKVEHYGRMGGMVPSPEEVVHALEQNFHRRLDMDEKFENRKYVRPENLVYKKTD